jgi:hypothetical protein
MTTNLDQEIDFVGKKKKIPWFTRDLRKNKCFNNLVADIQKEKKETSVRNILYSLLPISEYVASTKRRKFDRVNGKDAWLKLLAEEGGLIRSLSVRYGTQGNIPQRAAIILDYLAECGILPGTNLTVVELGCSAGLLGRVFCSSKKIFLRQKGELAKKFFWLQRYPRVFEDCVIRYVGYDHILPSPVLIPFYVWDKDKREKVLKFMDAFPQQGEVHEKSFIAALKSLMWVEGFEKFEPIVILTSFVLYQLNEPEKLIQSIASKVSSIANVHWLDLSRNSGLESVFGVHEKTMNLVPDHVYLSHNGVPVAHVINGSDDCPDWEYL